ADVNQLSFTDLKPFVSVSGAFIRDRLWYYATAEFIQEETPVNALTNVYVYRIRGQRGFMKTTWQANTANQLALSVLWDRTKLENQGITSMDDANSGYTDVRGGPTITLRESAVFSPMVLLESSLSWFDNSSGNMPTLDPDTNGNGVLFVDDRPDLGGDGDGIWEARERDPGEDWDVDGFYDVFEDANRNGIADFGEDLDHDGRVNTRIGCEGAAREDFNCNGRLDTEVDLNRNGLLDPAEDIGLACDIPGLCPDGVEPGTRDNHRMDGEDRNGNGRLDTLDDSGITPFPYWQDANGDGVPEPGEFKAPVAPDRDLSQDADGRTFGPYPYDYTDHRTRGTWREDLSWFLPDLGGTHDLKLGAVYEREGYDSDTNQRPVLFYPNLGGPKLGPPTPRVPPQVYAYLAVPARMNNTASGDNLGLYLQDTYKPVPNLTLGIGLRFDLESVSSSGYEFFDPASERSRFDRLMEVTGIDSNLLDDVVNRGLCLDPIHQCTGSEDPALAQVSSRLRALAFGGMTRHNLDLGIQSSLQTYFAGSPANLGTRVRKPEDFTIDNRNLSPRLSLSWDPWADGKTKTFASWGRYYGKLFLASVVLEQGPDTSARSYFFDADGVDLLTGLPNNRLGALVSQSPLSASQVDRSLATPYTDEWTLGIQRELAPELALGVRYIHRDFEKQLQDIDANHAVRRGADGRLLDEIGDAKCEKLGCSNVSDDLPDLYIQNFFFNRVFRLGNYNEQTYRAVELELVRRLHRKWQMEASYTYSIAQGDAESFLSSIGDDASLREFEPGYLSYDQRHVFKLNAMAYLPGNWRLGGTAIWQSGLPFSAVDYGNSVDDVGYNQTRITYTSVSPQGFGFRQETRNEHRNPASYLFNTRVQKDFVAGKSNVSAFFEIYNLLNADNLRISELRVLHGRYSPNFLPGEPEHQEPHKELVIGERDFGRRFQLGFQIKF
ncbi:MAG TPA: TonB-dependent receptor, partial [Candidatus Polarisedimenticolia bacterium]|nr:TonB-dependent receptor [Candidatus Polarisedimenticolia bacterium]